MNKMKILFVCTGNTCRSPMAEYLFKEINQNPLIEVESRGVHVSEKHISEEAQKVMLELYPESKINQHIPRQLRLNDCLDETLILTMSETQKELVQKLCFYNGPIATLKEFAQITEKDKNIYDPANAGIFTPKEIREYNIRLNPGSYFFRSGKKPFYFDPIRSLEGYRECRDEIVLCINKMLAKNLI